MRCTALAALTVLVLCSTAGFADSSRLPDGAEFPAWEKPLHFSKTYYVDNQAKNADDSGPGTQQRPFRTINHAAQILQPGERVVIAEGTYRESIRPARGGTSPDAMISYEAAPGAKVVVKGSEIVKDWHPSQGWNFGFDPATHQPVKAWELKLPPALFPDGYNPFEVDNVLGNRTWLRYGEDNMGTYFRRRGLVFVDGHPLEPVETAGELAGASTRSMNYFTKAFWTPLFKEFQPEAGKVWIEPNGMTLHIRLANDEDPAKHTIEITTREQVFSPAQRYQQYIRVKGITFVHAGNGFPVPQRGLVSVNRGNHFIFEDDTFEWANSVGLDIGNEDWSAAQPPQPVGFDVIRGNTFRYCGIEGLGGTGGPQSTLVEKNLFEWIGWQDAAKMSESGGTKMHVAHNLLFRNNVIRHIRHGNGIWLDIGNVNVRITGNVFADIPGDVNPHAVHIEGSEGLNEIDDNIFSDVTGGILIRDTNNVIIAYNLFLDCKEVCLDTTSGINGPRPIFGHTNDVHNLQVHDNVFAKWGRSAVELMNSRSQLDDNVYAEPAGGRFAVQPFIRIKFPEPPEWHNLPSIREEYGWEKNGAMANIDAKLSPDTLDLTMTVKGDLKATPPFKNIDSDFFGNHLPGDRLPGPLSTLITNPGTHNVDPRQPPQHQP